MLKLVRNHSPFTVLILFIYCLLLHLPGLMHPLQPDSGNAVYKSILAIPDFIFHRNAFCYSLLSVVMIFMQGVYLNGIAERRRLYLQSTYVPLFCVISVSALLPANVLFSPVLLSLWPVLMALDLILAFPQPQHPRANIFNAGFLLSLAALVYFPALGFLLLFIIALLLFRPVNAGEWIVGLLGYMTPLYFTAGILFLADHLPLIRSWPELGISLPRQMKHAWYLSVAIGGTAVLLWSGLYALQGALSKLAISVRRGWGAVVVSLIIAFIVAVLSPYKEPAPWRIAAPIIALVAALPVANEKRGAFSTFIFLLMLAMAVFGAVVSPHQ